MDCIRHQGITRSALASLPAWQTQFLGREKQKLIDLYSLYPDIWKWQSARDTHDNAVKYAGVADDLERYCKVGQPAELAEAPRFYEHYFERSLEALRKREAGVLARYLGSFAHYVGDMCAVAHGRANAGRGVFNAMYDARLFPPPKKSRYAFLDFHLLLEPEDGLWPEGKFPRPKPQFLGRNAGEAIFHILPQHAQIEAGICCRYFPAVLAFYRGDLDKVNRLRNEAYVPAIKLLADFIYTVFCIGMNKIPGGVSDTKKYFLSDYPPLDFQRDFVNNLYRGQALPNYSVERFTGRGWKKTPLALMVKDGSKLRRIRPRGGFGVGPNNWFSCYVGGAFSRLRLLAGNHACLGRESALRYLIEGDDRVIFDSGEVRGARPALSVDIPIAGVRVLKFICRPCVCRKGEGNQTTMDHGVWGNMIIMK